MTHKTTEEILRKAVEMKPDFVEWMRRHLHNFGDVTDQLRVMGHLGQAMVDMAQTELDALKLQEEQGKPKITLN